jgi:hypothetical protein
MNINTSELSIYSSEYRNITIGVAQCHMSRLIKNTPSSFDLILRKNN